MFNFISKKSDKNSPLALRSAMEMKDVTMNESVGGPAVHYYMIRGGEDKSNITVWEPGKVGTEYIKSYGHYHVLDFDERYEILAGEGIAVLQTRSLDNNGKPIDDSISSFRAIKVKAGDTVNIPRRAGHLMINTGTSWLVTRDNSPVIFGEADPVSHPSHADYEPFKKMRGAGYYVIEKDGSPALERNPRYTSVPEARIE